MNEPDQCDCGELPDLTEIVMTFEPLNDGCRECELAAFLATHPVPVMLAGPDSR
jgi:hypothetical protein